MKADNNSKFLMPNNHPITIYFIRGVEGRKRLVMIGFFVGLGFLLSFFGFGLIWVYFFV